MWNAGGPRVEGITNLGWTLVLALVHLLPLPDRHMALPVQLLGVVILFACAAVAQRIVTTIAPRRTLAITATPWLVLTCYPLVYWTLRGMEVGAVMLALLVAMLTCVRSHTSGSVASRDVVLASAACAAGVLTRLDFAVFVVALVVWSLRHVGSGRRLAVAMAGATGGMIVAQELFRRAYYGAWLPNTYALKVGGVPITDRVTRGGAVVLVAAVSSLLLVACVVPAARVVRIAPRSTCCSPRWRLARRTASMWAAMRGSGCGTPTGISHPSR